MEGLPQARRSGTKWSGDQALAGPGTRLAKQFAPKRIIKKNQKKADKIVCQKKKIIKKNQKKADKIVCQKKKKKKK